MGGVQFQPLETNTKNVLNGTVRFGYCLRFNLLYCATSVAKVSLCSTFMRSTVSFGYVLEVETGRVYVAVKLTPKLH